MEEQTSCLHLHKKFVWKHIKEEAPKDFKLLIDTAIPLTINIFEKVFLTLDKAVINEKDEPDGDEEEGKWETNLARVNAFLREYKIIYVS